MIHNILKHTLFGSHFKNIFKIYFTCDLVLNIYLTFFLVLLNSFIKSLPPNWLYAVTNRVKKKFYGSKRPW